MKPRREGGYPEEILQTLRLRLNMDEDDTSLDDEFNKMLEEDVLDAVVTYNGLVHYGYFIRRWIELIYGIKLENSE